LGSQISLLSAQATPAVGNFRLVFDPRFHCILHPANLLSRRTLRCERHGDYLSYSSVQCPHLPSWDFLSIPTADAKTILFIHRGTLFDEIDEVTKLSPGEAAASIQSFSMKHTPRCSAESDWEDLQQVAFQISAGVGEGGAAAVTQIVEQLTGTISRNIAAGAAVGAEAKSTSSARGVAGDPRVASGGVAGLFGPSPHRRLSGNFGSLPALDRQIVVDGANVSGRGLFGVPCCARSRGPDAADSTRIPPNLAARLDGQRRCDQSAPRSCRQVAWGFDKKQFRVEALEKCLDWFSTQGYAKVGPSRLLQPEMVALSLARGESCPVCTFYTALRNERGAATYSRCWHSCRTFTRYQ